MVTDSREVRFAVASDIHLGNKRTKTYFIITNLNKHLVTDEFMASIDILFLAGDLYDEELASYSTEYNQIGSWLARLLRKAHRYGVIVRLLEGTRSHDRGQGVQMQMLAEAYAKVGKQVDFHYASELSIEYIEKWSLHVLYVPDDLSPNPQDTLDQVKQLLRQHKLQRVDLAIMHGQFPHQIPAGIGHIPMHNPEEYSKLARLIFIGHVHTASVWQNIYAQGSFDRISHAEELPKGFYRTVMNDESYTVTFIENPDAAIYKTITCDEDSVADNLIKLGEQVASVPEGASLRIEAKQGNPIFENMGVVKERWPGYTWTTVVRDKEKQRAKPILDHKQVYVPVLLDRETLKPTLLARLAQRGYEQALLERCATQLSIITGGSG